MCVLTTLALKPWKENVSLSLHGCQRLSLCPGGRVLGSAVTPQMRFTLEVVCLRARSFVFIFRCVCLRQTYLGFGFYFLFIYFFDFSR